MSEGSDSKRADNGSATQENLQPSQATYGQLRAFVELLKQEFDGNMDLVRQALADYHAHERQNWQNFYEARREYVKQIAESDRVRENAIKEYGLQTLKWAFLLNAGAIALMLAYVGAAIGKSQSPILLSSFAPVFKAMWPFVFGCVLVVLAGAAGFFNFSYSVASLPSAEALHQFLSPNSKSWPLAKLQNVNESPKEFYERFRKKVNISRNIAICFASGSAIFFGYGVYRILRLAIG